MVICVSNVQVMSIRLYCGELCIKHTLKVPPALLWRFVHSMSALKWSFVHQYNVLSTLL